MKKWQWYVTLAALLLIPFYFSWAYGALCLLFVLMAWLAKDHYWWHGDRP